MDAYTEAYQRYCWPTDGWIGLRVAPFALLASAGSQPRRAWTTRRQLELADRLVAADPELFTGTRRIVVDTDRRGFGGCGYATGGWR